MSARKPLAQRKTHLGRRLLSPRLMDALVIEWEFNHAEHCTNMPHVSGDLCHWPQPEVLTGLPLPSYDPRVSRDAADRLGEALG